MNYMKALKTLKILKNMTVQLIRSHNDKVKITLVHLFKKKKVKHYALTIQSIFSVVGSDLSLQSSWI